MFFIFLLTKQYIICTFRTHICNAQKIHKIDIEFYVNCGIKKWILNEKNTDVVFFFKQTVYQDRHQYNITVLL